MKSRADRELVIVDIAVPRDVEPAVRDVPGVHLYDIDDLEAVADKNLDARRREVEAVEAIIEDEVSHFQTWLSGHSVQPVIAALRRNAEATRQSELDRTLKRLSHLSPADQRRVEAMSKALVKRLLHSPVARLREAGQERHVDAVLDLFDLDAARSDGETST
jgi:glutamyl-tRNA reductase